MGTVYRARDPDLQRDVAIKVLPDELAGDEGRVARLQREAHLLASCNHPNIASIYNLETSDEGTRWLVLEFVDGSTLRERLRQGPVSMAECLHVSEQVAGALEAAHEQGVVHRDLKAANVMVDRKNRVKVLDFSIAKDVSAWDAAAPDGTQTSTQVAIELTAPGMLVGTVPCMSPEQVRGQTVDARSDNWAFGCLMFELLTGQGPFDRHTQADTLSAILEHEPNWKALPPNTPQAVIALLRSCLHKDISARLQDIAEARLAIRAIATADTVRGEGTAHRVVTPPWRMHTAVGAALLFVIALGVGWSLWPTAGDETFRASADAARDADDDALSVGVPAASDLSTIAVLPFDNVGTDPADSVWSGGLAREVMGRLQQVKTLRVSSGTSTARLAARGAEMNEIGRALGVARVLEGNVLRVEQRLRVGVRLIDVATDSVLWSETYTGHVEDVTEILDIQADIAMRVVGELEVELTGPEADRLARRSTTDADAFRAYLSGLEAFPRRTQEALESALFHFQAAVDHDPDFALAHVGVADSYLLLRQYGGMSDAVAFQTAQRSVDRALELDPDLGAAHKSLASLLDHRDQDFAAARVEYERAISLNPNDALAHHWYGNRLFTKGNTDEARPLLEKLLELDPENPAVNETLGWVPFDEGRFEDALVLFQRSIDLDPDYSLGHMTVGLALRYLGRGDEAVGPLLAAIELNPSDADRSRINLASLYTALGRTADAFDHLRARVAVVPSDWRRYRDIGRLYRDAGQLEAATGWYQQALDRASSDLDLAFDMALLALDRGDPDEAERLVADLERERADSPLAKLARLNLDHYSGRLVDGARHARELGDMVPAGGNWLLWLDGSYAREEPLAYFGALAGRPQDSLAFLSRLFPVLVDGDDPTINGFNLQPAIDTAVVLGGTGERERADLLLERSLVFLDAMTDAQQRHEHRGTRMQIYALQGRTAEALDAMRQAIDIDGGWRHDWWRLPTKPHYASIRDEPGFIAMLAELEAAATDAAMDRHP